MQSTHSSPRLFMLSILIASGLFISACVGPSPAPPRGTARPEHVLSPAATQLSMRSMLVDVGGYRLYIRCMGQGTPTIIFDAGLERV